MRTAVFVGSFDPYTIGHDDILKRSLPLFDKIIIGVGVNERKKYMLSEEERVKQIQRIYSNEEKVSVESYSELTVDFASRMQAQFIIKGVRSVKDFEYEREQADINKRLNPQIETIILFASPELASISSSMVRELIHFGRDTKDYTL